MSYAEALKAECDNAVKQITVLGAKLKDVGGASLETFFNTIMLSKFTDILNIFQIDFDSVNGFEPSPSCASINMKV